MENNIKLCYCLFDILQHFCTLVQRYIIQIIIENTESPIIINSKE